MSAWRDPETGKRAKPPRNKITEAINDWLDAPTPMPKEYNHPYGYNPKGWLFD